MVKTTQLEDYKDLKKSKVIVVELEVILKVLRLTIRGLKSFNYYEPVKQLLPHLRDCKTILEIHLNHQKNKVEKGIENG